MYQSTKAVRATAVSEVREYAHRVKKAFTLPENFKISHIRYYVTVEPLGFLLYLGLYCLITVQPQLQDIRFTASYQDQVYDEMPNVTYNVFEDQIQVWAIRWNQYRLAANVPLALFTSTFMASYSDRNGRTFTILLGVAALMIGYCFAQAILYSYSVFAPLYTWIITTGFEGFMGNYQLSYFAGQAYQTDIVPDKNELTMRMNYVSIARGVGAAVGGVISGPIAGRIGYVMWVAGGNTIIFVAFIYVILWVPMIPPKQIEKAMNDYAIDSAGDRNRVNTILHRKATHGTTMLSDEEKSFGPLVVLRQMGREFRDAWATLTRKRTGYKRSAIWICCFVGFVSNLGGFEAQQLYGLYTKFVLNWNATEYGRWTTENLVVAMLGQFIGIFVMKRWLKMRDTWILSISILSFALSCLPQVSASSTWWHVSNYVQVLAQIQQPVLSSLITCFVEPVEVGRVLLGLNFTLYLAIIGQTWGLQFLYTATINDQEPWIMFLIVSALNLICIPMIIWVDYVEKPQTRTFNVDEIIQEEIEEVEESSRSGSRLASMAPEISYGTK